MAAKYPGREINLSTWNRARHYGLYAGSLYPFFGVTTDLDISEWDRARRRSGRKFFPAFLHTVALAANSIENYRYRMEGGKVILYETIDPSFVVLDRDEELFYFAEAATTPDPAAFDRNVEEAKRAALASRSLDGGRQDVFFVSCLPWFSFTDVIQPFSLAPPDSIPRILWGKRVQRGEAVSISFSITGHHALFDGIHAAKLLAAVAGSFTA